ncbi:tetratricopeptide repeat protein [Dyadobacter sp. LJ53]|uniref:tetratricopeptide repeat protein n=1 Tax=Dyadobacter chenwenxiniae TaxID=2906456 RepID=UPI001F28F153|nr:tetratricopeptide repeat protein [Dyadobacter chenwenxiniae]MCF0052878.1 tetratricopeptide repeat protein [Dyadobacter chenwenxiniae]
MKLPTIFILILASSAECFAQKQIDCSSLAIQDSLFNVYSNRARSFGYDHPGWDQSYDSLIAICPNIAEAYQEKGLPHLFNGNLAKVFEYNDKAVELDPKRWTAYRGYLHCIYAKNYDKAIVDFEKALTLTPNGFIQDHTFWFFLALCNMELGNYVKAESFLQKDIAQQKRGEGKNDLHFNSLLYFGIVYYLMNEYDQAEKWLRDCLQLYEQHPMANYYLAMTMKITGNTQQKLYFERARQYALDGYRMNEPNSQNLTFPKQVHMEEMEKQL